jgi:hypothetical protein
MERTILHEIVHGLGGKVFEILFIRGGALKTLP